VADKLGSLEDIEHIVMFMQENRAFDHYFGKMRGVRGFNDRSSPSLQKNGQSVWYQPTAQVGPNATSCHGTTCSAAQQGQRCSPGTPGSLDKNYLCCATKWVVVKSGASPCPSLPPATVCDPGQECLIQNQTCPPGTKGASPKIGNRCCGGWWSEDMAKPCPPPPPVAEYMLPFHLNSTKSNAQCSSAPEMDFPTDVGMWNHGKMDSWNTARSPGYGMGYYDRSDLPYYYALLDGFTVGDQHYQSTFTQTCPNRMHLFAGSNNNLWDKSNPTRCADKKNASNCDVDYMMMDNTEPKPGECYNI